GERKKRRNLLDCRNNPGNVGVSSIDGLSANLTLIPVQVDVSSYNENDDESDDREGEFEDPLYYDSEQKSNDEGYDDEPCSSSGEVESEHHSLRPVVGVIRCLLCLSRMLIQMIQVWNRSALKRLA